MRISKTPVREALARLQTEGLVTIVPRRGTFVFALTGKQVGEISELRLALEGTALRFAFEQNRQAFLAGLARVVDRMTAAREKDDIRGYLRLDGEFHEQFFRYCDNAYLADAYRLIAVRIAALRTHLASLPSHTQKSYSEHRQITRAVAENDLERALAILDKHIDRVIRSYSANIDEFIAAERLRREAARRRGFTPVA
jgi:DNA-binding GntR family transcriptional regulator